MKITKKLAKEIFKGDFSNVDITKLHSNARERTFKSVYDLKISYIKVLNTDSVLKRKRKFKVGYCIVLSLN